MVFVGIKKKMDDKIIAYKGIIDNKLISSIQNSSKECALNLENLINSLQNSLHDVTLDQSFNFFSKLTLK